MHLKDPNPIEDETETDIVRLEGLSSNNIRTEPGNCFSCDQCDYSTGYKHSLETHVSSVHLKLKPFKCDKCELSFGRKWSLDNHIKTVHLKVKRFACEHCEYAATSNRNLKRHIANRHVT